MTVPAVRVWVLSPPRGGRFCGHCAALNCPQTLMCELLVGLGDVDVVGLEERKNGSLWVTVRASWEWTYQTGSSAKADGNTEMYRSYRCLIEMSTRVPPQGARPACSWQVGSVVVSGSRSVGSDDLQLAAPRANRPLPRSGGSPTVPAAPTCVVLIFGMTASFSGVATWFQARSGEKAGSDKSRR